MSTTPIRIEQIRRAHASAKPKAENPAWRNTHHDLGVALDYIDELQRAADGYRAMLAEAPKARKPLQLNITKEWLQAALKDGDDSECAAGIGAALGRGQLPAPFMHRVSWTSPDGEGSWTQYHDADDPLPTEWDDEPPDEIIPLYTDDQVREVLAAAHADRITDQWRKGWLAGCKHGMWASIPPVPGHGNPAAWKLVPIEPTDEMVDAAELAETRHIVDDRLRGGKDPQLAFGEVYRAMVAMAPCPVNPVPQAERASASATLADRLDAMADATPIGSQEQSDLYAAATVWRKHLAPTPAALPAEAIFLQAAAICDEVAAEFGGVAEGPLATDFGKAIHEAMAAGAMHCAARLRSPEAQ